LPALERDSMVKGRKFKCNPRGKRFFAFTTRHFGPNRVFFDCYETDDFPILAVVMNLYSVKRQQHRL